MKKQISYIAPGPTAKALVLVYLAFSVPIVLIGGSILMFVNERTGVQQANFGTLLSTFLSAVILNAILAFVLLWIACHAYNWLASRFGGIEIQLSDVPEEV